MSDRLTYADIFPFAFPKPDDSAIIGDAIGRAVGHSITIAVAERDHATVYSTDPQRNRSCAVADCDCKSESYTSA
jgi:hypothetical protein